MTRPRSATGRGVAVSGMETVARLATGRRGALGGNHASSILRLCGPYFLRGDPPDALRRRDRRAHRPRPNVGGGGLATTLPEVTVSLSALRLGALDMAVGNLFGSNLFNVTILALGDLFFVKGAVAEPRSRREPPAQRSRRDQHDRDRGDRAHVPGDEEAALVLLGRPRDPGDLWDDDRAAEGEFSNGSGRNATSTFLCPRSPGLTPRLPDDCLLLNSLVIR
jgi:hypothetical protein